MKVLFICYDLGKTSTGITNLKMLIALLKQGIDCRVISSNSWNLNNFNNEIIHSCKSFPNRPARFFIKIGNVLGKDLDFYFWELRAKRKAKQICEHWEPNIIYARAQPPSVFQVGLFIAKKIKKALFLHSCDPIPPTPDWNNGYFYRKKKLNAVIEPLRFATEISFINNEMIEYQQTQLDFNITERSFVSPLPLVKLENNNKQKKESKKFVCLYLGSFFGSRSPELLINAFEIVIQKYNHVELHIVGADMNKMQPYLKNIKNSNAIKIFPRLNDVKSILAEADLLIDVDSPYSPQVFTSGKLIEYLPIDRPILCITPKSSASRNLLNGCKKSVLFSEHNLTQLIEVLETAVRASKYDFSDREYLINYLDVNNITMALVKRFRKYVI